MSDTLIVHRDAGERFDLSHQVPLVPQLNGMSCWAAAAAMIIGWREAIPVEGPDVAKGAGRWAAFTRGLRPRDVHHLAKVWGLSTVQEQHHDATSLRQLLERFGPLWIGEAVPGLHVVVVVGMHGDGTPEGTTVRINDPWPVGRGERYSVPFSSFIRNFRNASRIAGFHCQLLHAGGRQGSSTRTRVRWRRSIQVTPPAISHRTQRNPMVYPPPSPSLRPLSQAAGWAPDAQSPDYRHIGRAGMSQRFPVSHAVLEQLAQRNRFDLSNERFVLFGLRGCELTGSANAYAASFDCTETIPDHRNRRCVLGVWDRTSQQVAGFEGSTVPTDRSLRRQAASPRSLSIANLLPTGLYTYDVGAHRSTPGAFRQRGPVVVIRSLNDTTVTTSDRFLVHVPADNIHPAYSSGTGFSSAGCNTVKGTYRGSHRGDWADFRARAGLSAAQTRHSSPFRYMLLTGREARVSGTLGSALTRLRFGSRGVNVQALQDGLVRSGHLERRGGAYHVPAAGRVDVTAGRLRGDLPGRMLANTTLAYIHWQQANQGGHADGIVTPATARQLGFDPITRRSVQGLGSPPPPQAPAPAPAPAPAAPAPAPAPAPPASRGVFPAHAVATAQTRFQANAVLPHTRRRNCILILRDVAPQLWGADPAVSRRVVAALGALRGRDIKMTRFGQEIDALGLQSHRDEVRFRNGNGNRRPGAMVTSAWTTIMNRVGQQNGWHVFGMALFNGYHSVTIFVHKTDEATTLYWADQWAIDPGDDFYQLPGSVSGWRTYNQVGFDRFITEKTQEWWDGVHGRPGNPRWRASTWLYKWRSR